VLAVRPRGLSPEGLAEGLRRIGGLSARVDACRAAYLAEAERVAEDEGNLVAQVKEASSQRVPQVLAAWKQATDPPAAEVEAERLHEQRALHLSNLQLLCRRHDRTADDHQPDPRRQ